jgi:hypothetical protein
MKEMALEQLFALDKKQNRRDEMEERSSNDPDTIALNAQIRDMLDRLKRDITALEKMVENQGKNKKKFSQKKIE